MFNMFQMYLKSRYRLELSIPASTCQSTISSNLLFLMTQSLLMVFIYLLKIWKRQFFIKSKSVKILILIYRLPMLKLMKVCIINFLVCQHHKNICLKLVNMRFYSINAYDFSYMLLYYVTDLYNFIIKLFLN